MTAQKNFVTESFITALAIKAPVRTFSTGNVTLSGEQTINGVPLVANDRVLLLAQTDPLENGVWDVQISAWRRAADFDGSRDVVGGTIVPAYRSSDGEIVLYNVDGAPTPLTPGTDALNFSVYLDPAAATAEDLQATTTAGDTTDVGIVITDGGTDQVSFRMDAEGLQVVATDDQQIIRFSGRQAFQEAIIMDAATRIQFDNLAADGDMTIGCSSSNTMAANMSGIITRFQFTSLDELRILGPAGGGGADGAILTFEQRDLVANPITNIANFGNIWVQDSSDGEFMFTDDQGLNMNLSTSLYNNGAEQVRTNLLGATVRIALFVGDDDAGFGGGLGSIYVKERATPGVDFTSAGLGQFWVQSEGDNVPMFTSDAGTDQLLDPSRSDVNLQNGNYTTVLADKGKTIRKDNATASITATIAAEASVAYKIGTFLGFDNSGSADWDIDIAGADTLIFADDGSTGTRTLAPDGYAVAQKIAAGTWKIAGRQLT